MSRSKLTLSADDAVILMAKKQARNDGISLSAMFTSYILSRSKMESNASELSPAPLTRQALDIGREVARKKSVKTDRQLTEDALNQKYGLS
ncbi:MAG: hypothetical protein GXP32_05815 [Kiritimatiellaeota bacterium]|nr:hypothetical protein [Kiritimatiellota bacterium]